jgi:ketosteroid isomerase-like protein
VLSRKSDCLSGKEGRDTGKPYENGYCFVFDLAGGKVRAIREYVDLEKAKIALAP